MDGFHEKSCNDSMKMHNIVALTSTREELFQGVKPVEGDPIDTQYMSTVLRDAAMQV